jgi:hypothetical protein
MHESLIPHVNFYLDENEYLSSENYLLRGWVFSETEKIEDIKVSLNKKVIESKINFPILRGDVADAYPEFKPSAGLSGFEIKFKPNMKENDIQFEIKIKGKWVICKDLTIMKNRLILDKPISGVNLGNPPAVLAVDNFYTNPEEVRELALGLDFNPSGYHKGKRTEIKYIIDGTREKIEQLLGKKIRNWSSQPYNGVFQYCTPADPIVYHYDSQRYAGVVFLTPDPPPESGTSFYRHKKEKWLTKDPSEYSGWENQTQFSMFHDAVMGTEHDDYLDGTKWEEVDRIGNKFNRFAMWDAKLIHSATTYFGKSKENGRLFHMFFFDAY